MLNRSSIDARSKPVSSWGDPGSTLDRSQIDSKSIPHHFGIHIDRGLIMDRTWIAIRRRAAELTRSFTQGLFNRTSRNCFLSGVKCRLAGASFQFLPDSQMLRAPICLALRFQKPLCRNNLCSSLAPHTVCEGQLFSCTGASLPYRSWSDPYFRTESHV